MNDCKLGCIFNDTIINHLVCADNTALIAPSASAMQQLLAHCENFASKYDMVFNVKKTKCIVMKPHCLIGSEDHDLYLSSKRIDYVTQYKYLGVIISADNNDDREISKQCCNLYARGNTLVRNFKHCTIDVKCKLFKAFCSNFYCLPLWRKFNISTMSHVKVAYNRVFRKLFALNHRCSVSQELLSRDIDPFPVIIRKSVFQFKSRLSSTRNALITNVFNSVHFLSSKTNLHWNALLY